MKKILLSLLVIFIVLKGHEAQAQYDACTSAIASQVSLPYSASGQTTCGFADNFNGTISCSSPSSFYTSGPDVFYAFTASATGQVTINYTTTATSEYPSLIVFQGCPSSSTNATNCVKGTSTSSGNLTLNLSVTAGQTYVVMVDNWPSPPCLTSYGISISAPAPPPPGDACTSPISVTAPYCATGQTTCGFSDDFNGTVSCASPSSAYTTGPDVFYSFTPATGGLYQVSLTNTSPASHYGSIIVFQGCPTFSSNATNCVAGTSVSSGNLGLSFNATAGVTYYVMIDNYPSPSCFNYDICIQAAPSAPLQPPCTNLGFESGTTGWFGTVGTISTGGSSALAPNYNVSTYNTFAPQTSVMTAGTDPIGGFPIVFAGSQSLRIGDGTGTNYGGASVEQYFQVTTANSSFTYNYAVVLEDGGHSNYDQPFFQVDVFDQNGNPIPCGNYLITAPGTGFVQSTVVGYTDTWYKPWTTVSINLLSYVGQNVKIRFTAGDCSQGAHFGYAYVDCSCASYTINPITICQGSTGTLAAPTGALSYSWSPGGATTSSINVSPASTTVYTCTITSQGNTPCPGSLTTTVTVLPIPVVSATSASVCPGQGGNLTASGATTYTWSPATGLSSTTGATVTSTPASTTAYTVTGSNGTCSSTATATATVISPPTVAVNSPTICNGNSTTLTASGATTYSWTPSTGLSATTGASVSANPTVTTTYTVIGTTGSCTASATSLVTVNPLPTVTVNSPTICRGSSAALTASGATTYNWAPSTGLSATTGASVTANPTVTTTYTITGTTSSCTSTATSVITVNPLPTVTVNSPSMCVGGSVTLTAGGATTYTWSPATGLSATTGASVTGNPASTTVYTVTGTTSGCNGTASSTVTVNPTPTVSVNSVTMCPGSTATLTASGADTYTWSPSGSLNASTGASVQATPTVTTVYTITATSAAGCTTTATSSVTIGGSITPTVNSATICAGGSTSLTASGATTYTWSPGYGLNATTGATVTANPATTTTYTITGAMGGCTGTTTAMVTVNPQPTVTVNSPSLCVGNSVTLNASGATTYSWSPSTGLSASTGASVTANPTVTASYTVLGTSATCTSQAVSVVTVNPLPTVAVNNGTICNGGSANLTASGANTYTWSPATGLSATTGSTVTANPATTTNYTINGTSAAGCVNSGTTSVTVVTNPTVTANSATICIGNSTTLAATGASTYAWSPGTGLSSTSGTSVTANPASTTVYTITGTAGTCTAVGTCTVTVNPLPIVTVNSATICAGQQTATLTANGATTYTWSPSTGLSSANGNPVTATPSTSTPYTVTGTDANGCVNSGTLAVAVNPLPTITVNNGFICNGSTATLTAGGASTYSWSPGTGLSSTTGSSVTANPPSTTLYTVTGTDANGCVNSDTTSVTVISNPTVTVAPATLCIGDSTTLTASGANTYAWAPATGLSSTSGTSVTANPTVTTTYTITGTAGSCTDVTTAVVTVNPLPAITASSSTICVGQQTATLTASGGSTYSWSPSGSLSSSNGTSVTGTPVSTTVYTVTGTDANGCVNTGTTSITVNSLPILTLSSGFICVGGSVTLNASGASTYSWSPGTGLNTTTGSSVNADPATTTQYTVVGVDVNGCVNADTTTVTVVTNPTVTVLPATICIGSSATLTANGANTYTWTPSTTLSSSTGTSVLATPTTTTVYTITGTAGTCTAVTTTTVNVNPLPVVVASSNGPRCVNQSLTLTSSPGVTYSWSGPNAFTAGSQSSTISSVTMADAGIYTVTVTDANGCINTDTANVVINPLPIVTVTGATVCIGQTINLFSTPNGAASYSWNNPSTGYSSNLQNPTITNSTTNMSGTYVVTVTDQNGCASGNAANVVVNPALAINAVNNGPICEGASLVLGTGAGISWSWSGPGGFTSSSQTPIIPGALISASGTYTVVGTDANGCTGTATTTAIVNPLPVITVNSGTICATQETATLTAAGGQTYTWGPASSLSSANGSPVAATPMVTTIYTVTATDGNNCVNSATATVTVNQLPTIGVNSAAICIGNTATLTATGASSYTYSPTAGLGSATMNPAAASPSATTTYTVIGEDANGCLNTAVCTVTVNPLPTVAVNSGTVCSGATTTFSATGANTYNWSPTTGLSSGTGATVSAGPASTSNYVVTGTDINGCVNTATAVVTVNPLPLVEVGPAHSGCAPVCVSLGNTTSATGTCSWTFGDGSTSTSCAPTHCFTGQGTYNSVFTMTDANGCVGHDTAVVIVYPVPHADFTYGPIPASVFESTINFYDNSSGAVISQWQWTFGDPANHGSSIPNPIFNYGDPGTYPATLVVSTDQGCSDTITKYIVIDEDYMIYVPNAFSPNYDGVNDVFKAKGEGIKEFKMYIFDRWGNQVFFSDDLYKGWDGRFQSKGDEIVQEDVYVWKIELKTFKMEPHMLNGTVTLIK